MTSKNVRDSRLPDVPSIDELAPPGSKGLLGAMYASQNLSRSVALPPGVPADRVKVLRDAFAAMTKDEAFLKDSVKMGLEVEYIPGEEMNRDIETTVRDKRLMAMYKTITTVK